MVMAGLATHIIYWRHWRVLPFGCTSSATCSCAANRICDALRLASPPPPPRRGIFISAQTGPLVQLHGVFVRRDLGAAEAGKEALVYVLQKSRTMKPQPSRAALAGDHTAPM